MFSDTVKEIFDSLRMTASATNVYGYFHIYFTCIYYIVQDSLEANMCTSENYTGSICREVLQVQQSCLPDRNTTNTILIATDPTTRQLSKEEEAVKLIEAILSQSPTSKCVEELIPFLCFYIFPLCDSSGRLYQPSSVDCSAIVTNGTCANEIEIVTNLITEDECQVLPEISTTLKCNGKPLVLSI